MDEPRDPWVPGNVGLIAKLGGGLGWGLVPVRVPSTSPLPHCRPGPQHGRPQALQLVSALPQGRADLCVPQVHAGGGAGLRGAWPAHPRRSRAGDGRGRPALRPQALAEPRELRPREVSTAPSKGLVGGVSVRTGGSCQETQISWSAPKVKSCGNQREVFEA